MTDQEIEDAARAWADYRVIEGWPHSRNEGMFMFAEAATWADPLVPTAAEEKLIAERALRLWQDLRR